MCLINIAVVCWVLDLYLVIVCRVTFFQVSSFIAKKVNFRILFVEQTVPIRNTFC